MLGDEVCPVFYHWFWGILGTPFQLSLVHLHFDNYFFLFISFLVHYDDSKLPLPTITASQKTISTFGDILYSKPAAYVREDFFDFSTFPYALNLKQWLIPLWPYIAYAPRDKPPLYFTNNKGINDLV